MANEYRVTRLAVEALYAWETPARATRLAVEVLLEAPTAPSARVTRLAAEVLYDYTAVAGRRRGFMSFTP